MQGQSNKFFSPMSTLCNFEVRLCYFLILNIFLQSLTQAKAGTTWAAAPSRIASHEHMYIHGHTHVKEKVLYCSIKAAAFKSSLIVVKSM
jgi:hypothetical protein